MRKNNFFSLQPRVFSLNFGFTLLEVMVALAVIGGLLVTLIYTLNYNLGILERHQAVTVASLLAREKILDLEKSLNNEKGIFPEPYAEYSYDATIQETIYPSISKISILVKRDKEEIRFSKLIQITK